MEIHTAEGFTLVALDKIKTQTDSGLYLGAAMENAKQCKGTRVVGGDRVILRADYEALFAFSSDDTDFIIVEEEQIIATITGE